MTAFSPARPGASAWRIVAFASAAGWLGCESLVGIHDSQFVASSLPEQVVAASDSSGELRMQPVGSGASTDPDEGQSVNLGLEGSPGPGTSLPLDESTGPATGGAVVESTRPAPADAGSATVDPPDPPALPDAGSCLPVARPPARAGTAFLFSAGPNGGNPAAQGRCAFPSSALPLSGFYGAVEPRLMQGAALCGACLQATRGGKSVEVTIIDVIEPNPLAHGNTLSLDAAARSALGAPNQNPDVEFSFVPCAGVDTIRLQFANPGDASVLILGHRNALRSVRLVTPAASVELERQVYNFWEPPAGFSAGGNPVSLVLTDVAGNVLTLRDLAVTRALVDTGQQFPLPGCPATSE